MRNLDKRLKRLEEQAKPKGGRLLVVDGIGKTPEQIEAEIAALDPQPGEVVLIAIPASIGQRCLHSQAAGGVMQPAVLLFLAIFDT